jgi:hypothetical protein
MEQANLMRFFPDKDLTFKLGDELDCYNFTLTDTIQEIFQKYYLIDVVPEMNHITSIIDPFRPVNGICHAFEQAFKLDTLREDYNTHQLKQALIEFLLPVEQILGYTFNDKLLLLEAFTHSSFMESHQTGSCYEKLEVMGDAVLDYVANSNLIKFTMFEKYNVQERLSKEYVT